ncbi:MAG: HYR domain-containing protein [Saprospiraceae bacterium]|nr:HYR domain-containing protein [Saprospiraceae bacterium]
MNKLLSFLLTFIIAVNVHAQVEIFAPTTQGCDAMVGIPIKVNNFDTLVSLQFSFGWDNTVLQFNSVSSVNGVGPVANVNTFQASNGVISFSWFNSLATNVTLADSTTLFTVFFDVIGSFGANTTLIFPSMPTPLEAGSLVNGTTTVSPSFSTAGSYTVTPDVTVTCPSNIIVESTNTNPVTVNNIPAPTIAEHCGTLSSLQYFTLGATSLNGSPDINGSTFNFGTTNVTYAAISTNGEENTCNFDVTIALVQPTLTLESKDIDCNTSNFTVQVTADNLLNVNELSHSITWDNSLITLTSISNINLGDAALSDFDEAQVSNGQLGFDWQSTNGSGVTIPDGTVIYVLNFQLAQNIAGTVDIDFSNIPSPIAITAGTPPMSLNLITNNAIITLTDTINPVITCPSDTVVSLTNSSSVSINNLTPTIIDNCGIATITFETTGATVSSGTDASGTVFNAGVTNVTYFAQDNAGNQASCTFTVTVNATANVLFAAQDITPNCGTDTIDIPITAANFIEISQANFDLNWDATLFTYIGVSNLNAILEGDEFSNSGNNLTFDFSTLNNTSYTLTNGDVLFTLRLEVQQVSMAASQITFANVSASSNSNTVSSSATSGTISFTDIEPPSITCPPMVEIDINDVTTMVINELTPIVTDNCMLDTVYYVLSGATTGSGSNDASGTTFNEGITKIVYTAVDAIGNMDTCVTEVRLLNKIQLWTSNPTAQCGGTVSVDVKVSDFELINALGFTLNWNPADLQYSTVNNFNLQYLNNFHFGTSNTNNGVLTLLWDDPSLAGVTIPDSTTIFTINFNVLSTSGTASSITFGNSPTIIEATTGESPTVTVPVEAINTILQIIDTESPTITCPTFVRLPIESGTNAATANNIAPVTLNDNCGIDTVLFEITGATSISGGVDASGTLFNQGNNTVTYTVYDFAGNVASCSFDVRVKDTLLTIITGSATISCDDNSPVKIDVTTENFDSILSIQYTHQWDASILQFDSVTSLLLHPFSNFGYDSVSIGKLSFSWLDSLQTTRTFTDGTVIYSLYFTAIGTAGNASDLTYALTPTSPEATVMGPDSVDIKFDNGLLVIIDTVPPTLQCIGDLTILTDTNLRGNYIYDVLPNMFGSTPNPSDNCGTPTLTYILSGATVGSGNGYGSSIFFNNGTTNVTYLATDDAGNETQCSFNVYVIDTLNADSINTVTFVAQSQDLNCEASTTTVNITPINFDGLIGFQYTIAWDSNAFELTNINIPQNLMGLDLTDFAFFPAIPQHGYLTVSWFDNDQSGESAPDNIPLFSLDFNVTGTAGTSSLLQFNGDVTPIEISIGSPPTVTQVSFVSGNLNIVDTIPPMFTGCPSDTIILLPNGDCTADYTWILPTVIDNCDTNPLVTSSFTPPATFNTGVNQVMYIAVDASGNADTCSFTVIVRDTMPPVILSCPSDISMEVQSGDCGQIVFWNEPIATDECQISSFVGTPFTSGSMIPVGTTLITYIARDGSGNTDTCSFTVTIIDNSIPIITNCPGNITVDNAPGTCGATVTWLEPTIIDNCDINQLTIVRSHESGDLFPVGTTAVTYYVSDPAGNETTCTFVVTVNDIEPPVITNCTDEIQIYLPAGKCDTVLFFPEPTITDNCVPIIVQNFYPGDTFGVGAHSVVYAVRDASGTLVTCTFPIYIFDTIAPSFTDCPTDIIVSADASGCGANVSWNPDISATDDCGTILELINSHNPGDYFNVGTTTVTYSAFDNSGNIGICSFNVTVLDTQPPTYTNCPADISVNVVGTNCERQVFWTPPTINDNCLSQLSEVSSHMPGELFPVGTTHITYVITDTGGGVDSCSFNITVTENTAPVLINGCSDDIVVYTSVGGGCGQTVNWPIPRFVDNCDEDLTYAANYQPNDFYATGVTNVVVTATDDSGNQGVCSFNITVIDTIAPTTLSPCPNNITQVVNDDACGAIVTWMVPLFADHCNLSVNSNFHSGDFLPLGTTTVTYTAQDASGNTTMCSFTVTLTDNVAASAVATSVCNGGTIQLSATGITNASYQWSGPNTFTSSNQNPVIPNASTVNAGEYFVTITKPGGCQEVRSVTIQLLDTPSVDATTNNLTCSDGTANLHFFENGGDAVTWAWFDPNGNEFSQAQNPSLTQVNSTNSGIYSVVITDANGCTAADAVDVMISNNPFMPVILASDTMLCYGESVILAGSAFADTTLQYIWYAEPSAGSGIDSTINNPIINITPTIAGSYSYHYFILSTNGCSTDTQSVNIIVNRLPQVAITTNAPLICVDANTSLILNETGGDATGWIWTLGGAFFSNNQNNTINNATVANAGVYEVTAIDTLTMCTNTAAVDVVISGLPPTPTLVASDDIICSGSAVTLTGTSYVSGTVDYSWTAEPNTGSGLTGNENTNEITITPTAAGTYKYIYNATVDGCTTNNDTITVIVDNLPQVIADATDGGQLTCVSANDTLWLFEFGQESTAWQWSGPNNFGTTEHFPFIHPLSSVNSGTYYVTGFSANGCATTDSILVQISNSIAQPTISVAEDTICVGSTLSLSTNTIAGATYFWQGPGSFTSTDEDPIFTNVTTAHSGQYSLNVTLNGCTSPTSEAINVFVYDAPAAANDNPTVTVGQSPGIINIIANDTIIPNRNIIVTVLNTTINGTLENLNNGTFAYTPNTQFIQNDMFRYRICYVDCPDLCSDATVSFSTINDGSDCVIPNVLTPNDDGLNDELYIPCLENDNKGENEITIYNQWGDVVYTAQPYLNDWKGTYNGKPLPDGTYYYVFQQSPSKTQQKGYLTIFR